jgi:hypothetical protein
MSIFVSLFQILEDEVQEELRVALEMNLDGSTAEEAGEKSAGGVDVTDPDTAPTDTEQV